MFRGWDIGNRAQKSAIKSFAPTFGRGDSPSCPITVWFVSHGVDRLPRAPLQQNGRGRAVDAEVRWHSYRRRKSTSSVSDGANLLQLPNRDGGEPPRRVHADRTGKITQSAHSILHRTDSCALPV